MRALAGVVVAAGALMLGSGGPNRADARPLRSMTLAPMPEPSVAPRSLRPVLADAPPPLSRAESFAQRLAALAADRMATSPVALLSSGAFDHEALDVALTALLGGYAAQANLSVHVRDLATQRVLFDYYGDTPLIPASNQKLVTSAAAIDLLGSDYTFATVVARDDKTLYIRGEGDPSLGLDELTSMAAQVVDRVDMATIERLVVDDTTFSPQRFGPGYSSDGPGLAYQAPSGALSLDFNTIGITVFPVRRSPRLGAVVSVPGAHVVVRNHARIGSRNTLRVTTRPVGDTTVVEIRGRLPRATPSVRFSRRIYDPGRFTGEALVQLLAEQTASEPLPVTRGVMPADAVVLLREESEPLIEVLDAGLAYSNNFIAEQVLRTLAWRMTGGPGDWDSGQKVLEDYWSALVGDGFVAENGAGLTYMGRATTQGLVDLLSMASRAREGSSGLLDALPVAGEPGTMRMRLTRSGKRVRAKTGTLRGVSGLTGVIAGEDGVPQVAFSILINATSPALHAARRRAIEDQVVTQVLYALDDYAAG